MSDTDKAPGGDADAVVRTGAGLDPHDRLILDLLRDDGRLTSQELARRVGLSPSQCSRRRLALEQQGLILGYHAQLSPRADGAPLLSLIEVSLARQAVDAVQALLRFVRDEPHVRDMYKLTGDHDYLIKAAVGDLPALNRLLNSLSALPGCVAHLQTSVVLERIKESGLMLPLDP
ncbi:DNA-binding Lrp family transcriptional regulator [Sphaerotilus hippei]|uniref:DNA-binding Lrp family transcriptional regulator n=1 Tax=Sphaerotilus hippei TaxID=744406 RepID=A0A318H3M5_9BURK|nr:Lrp/AsnC family transcriptional regulator [Sphaerotilus hippei]PXW96486.1 DNA-binding Lrp family transcriptional regulator [Sphaerotilus hippei]